MLVSGSFLSDTIKPEKAIEILDKANVDFIHVDVMDGKFTERKSFTINDVEKYSTYTNKQLDIHLMVNNPNKYIYNFSLLNTRYITFHYEAASDAIEIINKIKKSGIKVGISIKPSTPVSEIFNLLPYLDLVLIMSVEPGKSGQKFIESVLDKIDLLNKEIEDKGYNTIISVDGGINEETFSLVKDKVQMVVSSSYLLSGNAEEKVKDMKGNK